VRADEIFALPCAGIEADAGLDLCCA